MMKLHIYPPPVMNTPPPNVKTELSKADFIELLTKHNTNSVVIKFGAEWCGPCKQIDPYIYQYMSQMPEDVQCFVLDIDDEASFDLYAFLKSKRMVNGVPVLLAYKAGNVSWVPDDVTVGANSENVHLFFQRRLIKK